MKNLYVFLVVLLGLSLSSCQFTEEISFNDNGSGTFKMTIDMNDMIDMFKSMENDTTPDSERVYEYKDTLINFDEFLIEYKDSIKNLSVKERAKIENLKGFKMHVLMDEKNKLFYLDIFKDFNDIRELKDIQKQIETAQKIQNNDAPESNGDVENHEVNYTYTSKKFSRNVKMLELSEEQQQLFDDQVEKASMFTNNSKYHLKYYFPKKIISTNLEGAQISEDGHTLNFEIEFNKLIENPELLDFEVKF